MAKSDRGGSFWNWLGRQVGHVRAAATSPLAGREVLYRRKVTREQPMPDRPGVVLRRTTIDEAVVEPKTDPPEPTR